MAQPPVLYEVAEGIATLTLNRPDRLNAWTPEMSASYSEYLDRASDDPAVVAIVLTGNGRGFCAGSDSGRLESIGRNETQAVPANAVPRRKCIDVPKPVIAAINGACAGLGLVIALECDLRFAAAGAKLTTSFVRLGLPAEHGLAWLLPRAVGVGAAFDLLFSGRVVLAEEAAQLGLVNRVVAPDQLQRETRDYAKTLVESCSPQSMATMKWQLHRDLTGTFADSAATARRLADLAVQEGDFREGIAAYAERRKPGFAPLAHPYLYEDR